MLFSLWFRSIFDIISVARCCEGKDSGLENILDLEVWRLRNVPSEFSVCGVCPSDRLKVPLSVHVTSDTSVSETDISLHAAESSCRRRTKTKTSRKPRLRRSKGANVKPVHWVVEQVEHAQNVSSRLGLTEVFFTRNHNVWMTSSDSEKPDLVQLQYFITSLLACLHGF